MNLIEIALPAGAVDEDERRALAAQLVGALLGEPGESSPVPEPTLRRARMMTHVAVRELPTWSTGDGPWPGAGPPPVWVTVTMPEAWREEAGRQVVAILGRALRRWDDRHGWVRHGGDVWVNAVGVADGSLGLDGRPGTADDVVAFMTEEFRAQHTAPPEDLPAGMVIDPMCGKQVRLGPRAITLEHEGATRGFCARSCRAAYARMHGIPVPG